MDRKQSGIYKIVNTINKKIYIGSAKSLYYRKSNHFSLLKQNKHHNKSLQNSYNKYGIDAFQFIVLEICSIKDLIFKEQYYLDLLKPHFNYCKTAGSPIGIKRSEETKLKIAQNHAKHNLGKKFSDDVRKNMSAGQKKRKPPSTETREKTKKSLYKPVLMFDLNMNQLNEFKSLQETSEKTEISYKFLSSLINGTKKSKKVKYIFKYKS